MNFLPVLGAWVVPAGFLSAGRNLMQLQQPALLGLVLGPTPAGSD